MQAVDQGYKQSGIIKLFGVSGATIKRYLKRQRETGHLGRKPIPGQSARKRGPLHVALMAQLEACPDTTLEIHCQLWEQTMGSHISTNTLR